MQKNLAPLLVAAALLAPITYGIAQAAPKARVIPARVTKAKKTIKTPAKLNTSGLRSDYFRCELNKSFTLYRDPNNSDYTILDWAGTRQRMHRVQSVTNAERYENNAKLTYIGAANLSQLIDFKQGRPLATECRNAEQQQVQAELNRKKAQEKAAAKNAQQKNRRVIKTSI